VPADRRWTDRRCSSLRHAAKPPEASARSPPPPFEKGGPRGGISGGQLPSAVAVAGDAVPPRPPSPPTRPIEVEEREDVKRVVGRGAIPIADSPAFSRMAADQDAGCRRQWVRCLSPARHRPLSSPPESMSRPEAPNSRLGPSYADQLDEASPEGRATARP
jgi:hypothetical protein